LKVQLVENVCVFIANSLANSFDALYAYTVLYAYL